MSLDVGYSYCINLTEEERLEIDMNVKRNRITFVAWGTITTSGISTAPIFTPPITPPSSERTLNPEYVTQQQQTTDDRVIYNVRGGENFSMMEWLLKFALAWAWGSSNGAEGYTLPPARPTAPHTPSAVTAKTQPNPLNANVQKPNTCLNQSLKSLDEGIRDLSPEFCEFMESYWDETLQPRFNIENYPLNKVKEMATDPRNPDKPLTKIDVDEARSAIQAQHEKKLENIRRPTQTEARLVDLDFVVDGPKPYTHTHIHTC